jgi:hypothetical protein
LENEKARVAGWQRGPFVSDLLHSRETRKSCGGDVADLQGNRRGNLKLF